MVFTILIVIAIAAVVAFLVVGVQKAKAEKKGIYAETEKCPYHGDEVPVGYETAAPAAAVVEEKPKKKPAAKKAPAKKPAAKKPVSNKKK